METGKGRYGSKETCVGVLLLQPGDEGKLCSSLIMIYAHTRMHAHTHTHHGPHLPSRNAQGEDQMGEQVNDGLHTHSLVEVTVSLSSHPEGPDIPLGCPTFAEIPKPATDPGSNPVRRLPQSCSSLVPELSAGPADPPATWAR